MIANATGTTAETKSVHGLANLCRDKRTVSAAASTGKKNGCPRGRENANRNTPTNRNAPVTATHISHGPARFASHRKQAEDSKPAEAQIAATAAACNRTPVARTQTPRAIASRRATIQATQQRQIPRAVSWLDLARRNTAAAKRPAAVTRIA